MSELPAVRPLFKTVKVYPPQGPLQQYRLEMSTAFECIRCHAEKKSKLIAVYKSNRDWLLCNGCYGRLLSIYDVKAGAAPVDEKAEKLAQLVMTIANDAGTGRKLHPDERELACILTPEAKRFVETALDVGEYLATRPMLDWSPAVIGLCKAVEVEMVQRVFEPLKRAANSYDLSADMADPQFGRIAKTLVSGNKPPELGSMVFFLRTATFSKARSETALIRALKEVVSNFPQAQWLFPPGPGLDLLNELVTVFRNRAAHTDELSADDFIACRNLVAGSGRLLSQFVDATRIKEN